ncbi:MAG: hypothetical protein Q8L24_02630 [bacterium]|nr:hypothetical protein [bacterium]
MPEKRSVGLLVFTHLPSGELVTILQRRGKFNDETMGPESYPGGCQLTVWGSAKDGETFDEALDREIGEEAGGSWLADFWIARYESKMAVHLEDPDVSGGNISAWTIYLPAKKIEKLALGPATGGIDPITEEKLPYIQDLEASYTRESGVRNLEIIAMFNDAKDILKKGFAWAKTLTPES